MIMNPSDIHERRPLPEAFGVILAADFTRTGDDEFRLSEEMRYLSRSGETVGLLQIREPAAGEAIAPEIRTCVRRGIGHVVDAGDVTAARNLILHRPSRTDLAALPVSMPLLREVVLVCYSAEDFDAAAWSWNFGPKVRIRCAPVNPFVRAKAPPGMALEKGDWLPPGRPRPASVPYGSAGHSGTMRRAVGWIGIDGISDSDLTNSLRACSDNRNPVEHFLPPQECVPPGEAGAILRPLPPLSLDRLVSGLDILVVANEADGMELPDTLIAAALDANLPVVMPRRLAPHYGQGPFYFESSGLAEALGAAFADAETGAKTASRSRKAGRNSWPRARGTTLARIARRYAPPKAAARKIENRPVLCLASNGVGVGHLTRLLAIARHLESGVVFATQAPAPGLIEGFGYPAEYIPSAAAVGGDFDAWDEWFKAHLDRILDTHDPCLVAYDGNHPSWGLIKAVASRRDCRLAWIRRGMWANTTSAFLDNARWCDLVIEPGDLAQERDSGVTALRRQEVLPVEPIRLLDEAELLGRAQAADCLGLNAARPAVLIQLGSGYNRDLLALLDQMIGILASVPGLQIVVAEWVNGTIPLTLWPNVVVLRGFPISQYIRAFDFCVSAAGYNSFHELIGFGVPTIFVANQHPSMDDQYGRAKFAQDNAAAFEISEKDLSDLPELVALLLNDKARGFLSGHCKELARPNGAIAAADALQTLARNDMMRYE